MMFVAWFRSTALILQINSTDYGRHCFYMQGKHYFLANAKTDNEFFFFLA